MLEIKITFAYLCLGIWSIPNVQAEVKEMKAAFDLIDSDGRPHGFLGMGNQQNAR